MSPASAFAQRPNAYLYLLHRLERCEFVETLHEQRPHSAANAVMQVGVEQCERAEVRERLDFGGDTSSHVGR